VTATCVHVACDRPQRARTLCERHYAQLKRSGLGPLQRKKPSKAEGLQLWAQEGTNRECVECGEAPLFGGMRCLTCFQVRADWKRQTVPHRFPEPPSYSSYKRGCKCRECQDYCAAYTRGRRARQRAAEEANA